MDGLLPLQILWDRWTTVVNDCPLVDRVARPALLPHLRAVDAAQQADAPHTLALSGVDATADAVQTALVAAGPRAVAAGWPAALPGAATDDDAIDRRIGGYAEALLDARLAILDLLQGAPPVSTLVRYLNVWRYHIVNEHLVEDPAGLPTAAWSAAERQPSWSAQGILLHLALHRAQPWPTGVGRTARLLMNTLVAAAGHPWLGIPAARRTEYESAVAAALATGDAQPFCRLLLVCAADAPPARP